VHRSLVLVLQGTNGVGFDEDSFATEAFDTNSWWFDLLESAKRFVVNVKSYITKSVTLFSRID
jgi:hypothetical protein